MSELKVTTEVKKVIAWKDCEAVILDGKIRFATVEGFDIFAERELNSDPEGFLRWISLVVKTFIESRPKPPRKEKSSRTIISYGDVTATGVSAKDQTALKATLEGKGVEMEDCLWELTPRMPKSSS